jgi:hypothetical protein
MNRTSGRRTLASVTATCAILAFLMSAGAARAWNDEIVKNCADDYFTYCKQHDPDGPEVRYCMEAHRTKLSKQCIQALVDAGEVPKRYLVNNQSQPKK